MIGKKKKLGARDSRAVGPTTWLPLRQKHSNSGTKALPNSGTNLSFAPSLPQCSPFMPRCCTNYRFSRRAGTLVGICRREDVHVHVPVVWGSVCDRSCEPGNEVQEIEQTIV
ncbi:hypothetical protein KC19_9G106900 [Ceratodon purpureus]|uniref:Uncharacterized protein n=1 Tax=Ceratodon purpureus TaxID=3225 RepID=A0A8T0GSQ9_CERPU|nr:hypothetical protein KC19_9G106900 [Ceratodon purpureus]